ncbi:MAG: fibronectin type III domain-containing protein [Rikenellaceae bacterium]
MKKNALKPVLFVVLGLIITTIAFANPFDVPEVTLKGYITDGTNGKVSKVILFCEVYKDGGADVEHYLGEVRDNRSSQWEPHCVQNPEWYNRNKCDLEFHNLNEGHEYDFRARAANKAGIGAPAALGIMIGIW